MKLLLISVFLIAGISLATSYSSSWGNRNYADQLLTQQPAFRHAQRNVVWSVNVKYPGYGSRPAVITAIQVIDNFRNNSGPYNSLQVGGPRYEYATVNIRSQNSQGINSTVYIWGKYK